MRTSKNADNSAEIPAAPTIIWMEGGSLPILFASYMRAPNMSVPMPMLTTDAARMQMPAPAFSSMPAPH